MAGTAEPRAHGDFVNGQPGFAKKQILRTGDALSHNVCVGRHTDGLTKRALKMARAYPGEFAELAQSDGLRKILFYVIQDQLETTPREAAITSRSRRRDACISLDHFIC